MTHIKYKLDKSSIHGIGVFADQIIKKGEVIFTASPLLDVNITQEQFVSLQEAEQKEIRYWGFFDKPTQRWHVDFDHMHFINHSYNANTTQDFSRSEAYILATKDIRTGEELTQNYLEFESMEDLQRRGVPVE
jgi:SET domain-containing protein